MIKFIKIFFKEHFLNNKYSYISGLLSFVLYSLSFLIGYEEESANHLLVLVKAGLIVISACMFIVSCRDDSSDRIKTQFVFLNLIILLYQILLMAAVGRTILLIRDYPAILNSMVWIVCSSISIIRLRKYLFSYCSRVFGDQETRILVTASVLIAAIVIILSAEPNGVRFTWDSDTLYGFIYGLGFESLYDARLMTFHSHVSIVYAHILVLLKILLDSIHASYFILNSFCIIAASFGTIFVLRELVPGKKPIAYIMGGAMFMFSPWVCGLSTYHMYDYYIWCLFPLLIYYYSRKNWIGFTAIGIMITFSKASGLIVFGSVCFGMVITDIIAVYKSSEDHSVKRISVSLFQNIRYWLFLSVALIFYVFFKSGIAEVTQFEDTEFGFDTAHIVHLLKLYMTANYIWIFIILTIVLIIRVYAKSNTELSPDSKRIITVILISDILFIVFNCLCITYRLPRYMNSHIAVVYLCGAALLLCIKNTKRSSVIMVMISLITLIGAFRMTDPVSLSLFNRINVGDHNIVDFEMTDMPSFEDSIICNREYYSYEILLNKVLTYVINDRKDTDEIMFSLGDRNNTWGFSGGRYSYTAADNKRYFEEFYDRSINGLANGYAYEYWEDPNMIPFSMRYIFPQEALEDAVGASESNAFYYIYMPTMNESKEQGIYNMFNVIDEKQFSYRGWYMNCIKFDGSAK